MRREAQRRGLQLADKPDSHDICFIADGDTQGWLSRRLGSQRGPIVASDGSVVGEHTGAYAFTVGQRKGLRIGVPAPDGRPRYVLAVEPVSNTVVVGTAEELDVHRLAGERATWCGPAPIAGAKLGAQVRAHGEEVAATVDRVSGDLSRIWVSLSEPLRGVAPGQTLALYDGTRVVGSATITG